MAYPARNTVFGFIAQAMPARGATLFQSVFHKPRGTPFTPANSRPPVGLKLTHGNLGDRALRISSLRRCGDRARRGEIEAANAAVEALRGGKIQIPAQPEVYGQLAAQLPIVLQENADVLRRFGEGRIRSDIAAGGQPDQECGHSLADRAGGGVVERTLRPGGGEIDMRRDVPRRRIVLSQDAEFAAEAERMISLGMRGCGRERVIHGRLARAAIGADGGIVVDGDLRETW